MKVTVVINDSHAVRMEYQCTGILNQPIRRAVELELTPEQIKKIGLKVIGKDCGSDILETIESISLAN